MDSSPQMGSSSEMDTSTLMRRWFEWVLAHRTLVVAVLALCSLVSVLSLSQAVVATSMVKLFLGDDPAYVRYLELLPRFGSDEVLLLGYESASPLDPGELARLKEVVHEIEGLPGVLRVQSVLNAERVEVVDGALSVERYVDMAAAGPEEAAQRMAADPRAGGIVIGKDGHNGAVVVEMVHDKHRSAESGPALVRAVKDVFVAQGFPLSTLHASGLLAMLAALLKSTFDNVLQLFPYTLLVMVVSVQLLLRRFLPVLVSTGVALLAVLWTMGFSTALDPEINVMIALVPAVILIVAISDVVHLWSAYLVELSEGYDREEAILRSAADVGTACLLTSATTFVGFVSLAFIPTPIYRHLGLVMGFGVAVALVLAMTFMPVLLSWLPAPEGVLEPTRADKILDRLIAWISRVTVEQPGFILSLFALAIIPMAAGINKFNLDASPLSRMSEKAAIRIDSDWFSEHFAAVNFLEVFVEAPEGASVTDPALLRQVSALTTQMKTWPQVDNVVSLADVIADTHKAFAPDLAAQEAIPSDPGVVSEYLFLFDMASGDALSQLVDSDHTTLHIMARLKTDALREIYLVGEHVAEVGQDILPEGVRLTPSGLTYMFGGFLDDLIAGQRQALGFSILSVAFFMIVGLRSIPVGLWSMVPNILPPVVVLGTLGLAYDRVDSDNLVAVLMAVGIGVDDTIHFLMRYRIESRRYEPGEAIRRTFAFAGRAIIQTTVILSLGFLPLAFSDYLSIRLLGLLLPAALVVALIGDLFLLPALTALGLLRFPFDPVEPGDPSAALTEPPGDEPPPAA